MKLLNLLGIQKKASENKPYSNDDIQHLREDNPYPYKNILHLWEDDYLMLELLPNENLEFVKAETSRVNNFAREHFDGIGFTDITPINDKPIKTIEKLIAISDIEKFMVKAKFEKINQFHMQGVGLLQGDRAPLGFGTNKFAIMCDKQTSFLKNIWVTGHADTEEEKQKLVDALLLFGKTFNFTAVNWYRGEYYNLEEKDFVEKFVADSC